MEKAKAHKLRAQETKGVSALEDYQCPFCNEWTATERKVGLLKCAHCGEKFTMGRSHVEG